MKRMMAEPTKTTLGARIARLAYRRAQIIDHPLVGPGVAHGEAVVQAAARAIAAVPVEVALSTCWELVGRATVATWHPAGALMRVIALTAACPRGFAEIIMAVTDRRTRQLSDAERAEWGRA